MIKGLQIMKIVGKMNTDKEQISSNPKEQELEAT